MASNDSEIADRFVAGEPVKRGLLRRTKGSGPRGGSTRSHNLYEPVGTVRFGVNGNSLLSYGHWMVAFRLDTGVIILNGDNGPSATTRGHQREARYACKRAGIKRCILPFSALTAASVDIRQIEIVATTDDREVVSIRQNIKGEDYEHRDHFLGETLFRSRGRLYVCGLDRGDAPKRRKYFLARLPEKSRAKTVDEALLALRPKKLPKTTLRQGEWFLVPFGMGKPPKSKIEREYPDGYYGGGEKRSSGVPILSDKAAEMEEAFADGARAWFGRHDRHKSTRMFLNGKHVFVSGMLRDAEHGPLKLGDGKQWYRVVRNLADGSWSANGDVD